MKGLLHSKRFKTNLYRWLFMYVGVLGLLTCVITYSKFISKMNVKDEARTSQFDVSIDYDANLSCSDIKNCSTGQFELVKEATYRFIVDTTKLEVNTDVVLSILVDSNFHIVSLKNVSTNEEITLTEDEKNNIVPITTAKRVIGNKGKRETYEITVKYKDKTEGITKFESYNILRVGFSAKQVEKGGVYSEENITSKS